MVEAGEGPIPGAQSGVRGGGGGGGDCRAGEPQCPGEAVQRRREGGGGDCGKAAVGVSCGLVAASVPSFHRPASCRLSQGHTHLSMGDHRFIHQSTLPVRLCQCSKNISQREHQGLYMPTAAH